jgi:hypothetical protein
MRPLSPILCCRSKAINITYSESVSVALFIKHAKRMRSILLSSVACLFVPNFSLYFINVKTFCRKKIIEHKMCFDIVYNYYLKHFLFQKEFSEFLSQIYTGIRVKYPLLFSGINETRIFSTYFRNPLK